MENQSRESQEARCLFALEHYFRKHLTAIVSAVKAGTRRSRRVA
jgi:hypothetical protein